MFVHQSNPQDTRVMGLLSFCLLSLSQHVPGLPITCQNSKICMVGLFCKGLDLTTCIQLALALSRVTQVMESSKVHKHRAGDGSGKRTSHLENG